MEFFKNGASGTGKYEGCSLQEKENEWRRACGLLESEPERAFEILLELSESGFAPASNSVGECYQNGRGVSVDLERAEEYYRIALRGNDENSLSNLFFLYIEQNDGDKALEICKFGINNSMTSAYGYLFSMVMGQGAYEGNILIAAYLATKAYEASEDMAFCLGYCYLNEIYFPQVYPYAKYCFEKSGMDREGVEEYGELPEYWDELESIKPEYPPFEMSFEECEALPNLQKLFEVARDNFLEHENDNEKMREARRLIIQCMDLGYTKAMYYAFMMNMFEYEKWLEKGGLEYGDRTCLEMGAVLYSDMARYEIGNPWLNKAVKMWNKRKKLHGFIPMEGPVKGFYSIYQKNFNKMMGIDQPVQEGKGKYEGNALLLKTSGKLECITVDFNTLEGLYAPLNSSGVSALSTQRLRELSDALGFTVVMYCDRHGAEKRLAENERAAELTGYDVIFGNTVVCSFSKDYAPFTAEQLDIICSYFDV